MGIEILDTELDVDWLQGAQITYVDSVVAEPSDGGVITPVGRQVRPLLQATFETWDAAEVAAMFGTTRSGRKAFFIRPPVDRYKKVTGAALGTATGAEQTFQLQISLGELTWNALYPVESTIIIYGNGVAISDSAWTLGDDGEVTVDAAALTNGHSVTATFEYKTAVRFIEAQLEETIQTLYLQTIQTVTVREVF